MDWEKVVKRKTGTARDRKGKGTRNHPLNPNKTQIPIKGGDPREDLQLVEEPLEEPFEEEEDIDDYTKEELVMQMMNRVAKMNKEEVFRFLKESGDLL